MLADDVFAALDRALFEAREAIEADPVARRGLASVEWQDVYYDVLALQPRLDTAVAEADYQAVFYAIVGLQRKLDGVRTPTS